MDWVLEVVTKKRGRTKGKKDKHKHGIGCGSNFKSKDVMGAEEAVEPETKGQGKGTIAKAV